MHSRVAGIDIGTNTILMLVAGQDESGKIITIHDAHAIARLGEGVDKGKKIQPKAIERAREILSNYSRICNDFKVNHITAVGTAALRDATNSADVILTLSKAIGTDIKIISGEDEACLSFMGTVENDAESLVIDVGGGSTELVYGVNQSVEQRISLNIGSVRLTERYFKKHPPENIVLQIADEEIKSTLKVVKIKGKASKTVQVYAIAGTPTTLAAVALGLDEVETLKVHGYVLTLKKLNELINLFLASSVEEIVNELHIHPRRADVITAGAIILKEILLFFGYDSCIVSSYGLRYGLVKEFLKLPS